jgi:hypothetical protein
MLVVCLFALRVKPALMTLAGLLIFGRKNMYLIDSLVYTPEGEVIDAKDAPKDILSIPSGTLVELDPSDQLSLRW